MPSNFTLEAYYPRNTEGSRGTLEILQPEGYKPPEAEIPRTKTTGLKQHNTQIPRFAAIMTMSPFVVHTFPPPEEQVYHHAPSENSRIEERLDKFQEQFLQL